MTPCRKVLLKKHIVAKLVKKFAVFHVALRFITVFTRTDILCMYVYIYVCMCACVRVVCIFVSRISEKSD